LVVFFAFHIYWYLGGSLASPVVIGDVDGVVRSVDGNRGRVSPARTVGSAAWHPVERQPLQRRESIMARPVGSGT
jgi:hypothetical protein